MTLLPPFLVFYFEESIKAEYYFATSAKTYQTTRRHTPKIIRPVSLYKKDDH
jgi:hypothetical protein